MNHLSLPHNHPQISVFESVRAEQEGAWLSRVFVKPQGFERMTGMRSLVVFGESGAGKSMLALALARYATQDLPEAPYLVVDWRPTLPPIEQTGSQAVRFCLTKVFDACALALLRLLGQAPERFSVAPKWVQETIRWFVHSHLSGDLELHISRLEEEATVAGRDLLNDLRARVPRAVLSPDAPEVQIIAELANAVQRLGLAGVWLIIDGLEPWIDTEDARLAQLFKALFSTLALFEDPAFAMKVMAPSELASLLSSSGGIVRRRMDVFHIHWETPQLVEIVERRLAIMAERAEVRLADLYQPKDLHLWLERYGGHLPRGWLEQIRPFAEAFAANHMTRPLTEEEWDRWRRAYPPRLRIDTVANKVFIGYGEVQNLQTGYKILRYLYEQSPRTCTRSELYYRAYLNRDNEPQTHLDPGYELPKEWGGIIDTIIWRLRQVIEPDPRQPLYIISDRGRGVRLQNHW